MKKGRQKYNKERGDVNFCYDEEKCEMEQNEVGMRTMQRK